MWVRKIQIILTFLLITAQETLAVIKMDISIFSSYKKDQRYPGLNTLPLCSGDIIWKAHAVVPGLQVQFQPDSTTLIASNKKLKLNLKNKMNT